MHAANLLNFGSHLDIIKLYNKAMLDTPADPSLCASPGLFFLARPAARGPAYSGVLVAPWRPEAAEVPREPGLRTSRLWRAPAQLHRPTAARATHWSPVAARAEARAAAQAYGRTNPIH